MNLDRSVADGLCAWLIREARLISSPALFLNSFGERLRDTGLGVTRITTGVPTLHPNIDSFSGLWELGVRNDARREAGGPEIGFGIALHFGDVLYGNVGGESRLDFTATGPAVNLASRIEGLTRELEGPVLVSAEFAAAHGGTFEPLGQSALKGIAEEKP